MTTRGTTNYTSEEDIGREVVQILALQPGGEMRIRGLIGALRARLNLTSDDLVRSETRPNEAKWEQRVRNITSHRKTPGTLIAEGLVEKIPGGLRITAQGRARAAAP